MKKITDIKIVVAPIDILTKELKNIRGGKEDHVLYCKDGSDSSADLCRRGGTRSIYNKVISAW